MTKRIGVLALALSFLFTAALARTAYVSLSGNYTVSSGYNSYALNIENRKQTLFDCNMKRLSNNINSLTAVIRPTTECLSELDMLFSQREIAEITKELSKGYPVAVQTERYAPCKYIRIFENKKTNETALVKFVKRIYDKTVYTKKINFAVDAKSRLLEGNAGEITEEYSDTQPAGVVLTIDSDIQNAVEEAAKYMKKGAVAVMDAESAQILALYSAPNDNMFRPTLEYTVGSVFKLVVCACAIEKGIEPLFECEGSFTVGDTDFSCQHGAVHGNQDMKTALANSCNCYFIQLALEIGADDLYDTARALGFGGKTEIMPGYVVDNGNLPSKDTLQASKGQLSLLGFGQGLLTSTPLQMCAALCALSSDGLYSEPKLVAGTVDFDGNADSAAYSPSSRILKPSTCKKLRELMRFVVSDGTGAAADYNSASGGKTSTAQSGIYKDGTEVLNTWFAGVYPYDDPQYCIVVMTEDGSSGAGDCCPVFRTIVENIS